MSEPEKRGPGRPPKYKNDDQEDRRELEQILSELDTNATVKVHRTDPEWASGYCGQFYIAQGRGLTTEEIKNRFGGRVLQLTIHGPNGKYVKRQTIVIDDIPRREGQPVQRDGTILDMSAKKGDQRIHPLEQILGLGLPPHLTKQISNYYLGADNYHSDDKQTSNGFSDVFGAVQMQKMMMDMMNQSNTAQMQMMQSQFEMQKSIMNARRDFEESAKPKDPLGDVNNIIRVVRELNGIKAELGAAPESMTGQILESTMPMVETLLTEYMAYMKLKAQAELQRPRENAAAPPALPQRQISAASRTTDNISNDAIKPTPVSLAQQMAQMYQGLSPSEKQEVNLTFLAALNEPDEPVQNHENTDTMYNNMDRVENCDNMEQTGINTEYLDSSDLELLTNGGVNSNQNATGDVQNSEHTGSAEKNDSSYRQGDT